MSALLLCYNSKMTSVLVLFAIFGGHFSLLVYRYEGTVNELEVVW